mmetsp:Transcript_24919/g.71573  ORF Transcript_24919/g.71573 Transcript_24919/m.71573 type:complete len:303 (-) Transcript_24919:269-1177(-)
MLTLGASSTEPKRGGTPAQYSSVSVGALGPRFGPRRIRMIRPVLPAPDIHCRHRRGALAAPPRDAGGPGYVREDGNAEDHARHRDGDEDGDPVHLLLHVCVAVRARHVAGLALRVAELRQDPPPVGGDARVHAGEARLRAPIAKADDADERVAPAGRVPKERAARVALAAVDLALGVPRANHGVRNGEVIIAAARRLPHHGHGGLLQRVRSQSALREEAPARDFEACPLVLPLGRARPVERRDRVAGPTAPVSVDRLLQPDQHEVGAVYEIVIPFRVPPKKVGLKDSIVCVVSTVVESYADF